MLTCRTWSSECLLRLIRRATLTGVSSQAAVKAARDGAKAVDFKHFEWAKDRIIMGAERKTSFISEEIKKMTAYHEVGDPRSIPCQHWV